ncbi:unnamed protein product, partial [marine sediment metagenome]
MVTYTELGEVTIIDDMTDPALLHVKLKKPISTGIVEQSIPLTIGNKLSSDGMKSVIELLNKSFPNLEIIVTNNIAVAG